MIEIIPAVLPQTYRDIEQAVGLVHEIAPTIQIDFCDGKYVESKTWWFNGKDIQKKDDIVAEKEGLPFWDSTNYEFDLMIADPLSQIDTFVALGPSKIIFHKKSVSVEALLAYFETLPEIVRQTISFGIALQLDEDPTEIAPLIPYLRRVQCMGIEHIGTQGQPFTDKCVELVKKVQALYGETIRISVDGGVNAEHIPALVAAGARRLVVGSAVFQSIDPHGTIQMLQDIANA
jgi:pentose-5-phosphate-3-epimerase